ncbi:amidohydrolase [Nissabacter sp. SGAir0207]|uniref:amidohydrolase n=1 Tax=Nissabacter sp. SGAir0207 TaxID=2126321 RepID=UPI0010CD2F95|nr:amidohydrolase [Nissabacter sp. SGAir0207]QCR35604.1 hypothetical protein C1N62_05630 [Nissabacter sp. SGAir0207]
MKADTVFVRGRLWTADDRVAATALAVVGERIVCVGSDEEVMRWVGDHTRVVDLAGRMMIPGFHDGHCHYTLAADEHCGINLKGLQSAEACLAAIQQKLVSRPDAPFLRGGGFLEALFPDTGPRKEWLDALSSEMPIAIAADTYHSLWVNSAALALAGITAETPDPHNGRIERDADGSPSGCLRETAQALVLDRLPDWPVEEYKAAIVAFQQTAHTLGLVAACDPWLDIHGRNAVQALRELDSEGKLAMHLRGAYLADPAQGVEQCAALLARCQQDNPPLDATHDPHFRVSAIKFFCDGIFETKTARMLHPYAAAAEKGAEYYGEQNWEAGRMKALFAALDKAQMQIHVHCIGDGAVRQTLDALAFARSQNGARDARHCIAHATACAPEDMPRFRQLDVTVMLNTFWAERDETWLMIAPWVGAEIAEHYLYPVKSFFDAGVRVTNASDYPVTPWPNPLIGIETAVTRQPADNYHPWVFDYDNPVHHHAPWPEERAGVEPMLLACTLNQAVANFMEEFTGSLSVGKYADLVILDRDLLPLAPAEIGAVGVVQTWFKGRCVYTRPAPHQRSDSHGR